MYLLFRYASKIHGRSFLLSSKITHSITREKKYTNHKQIDCYTDKMFFSLKFKQKKYDHKTFAVLSKSGTSFNSLNALCVALVNQNSYMLIHNDAKIRVFQVVFCCCCCCLIFWDLFILSLACCTFVCN